MMTGPTQQWQDTIQHGYDDGLLNMDRMQHNLVMMTGPTQQYNMAVMTGATQHEQMFT
jgi:hypothetical protein